ncbi:GNAT family N-acetyltransferase [Undibacterium baiyunense]|jgi:predicted N-acetyltransferase YhbS|uniref:GNAT family N-acetyltransferase n=1 Tax=Undibacterium baiyunense TaxID=2828731 RepID=A0A941DG46_9BURK|nr:GNAT family N-acetyltransferase [Undibacterium baiyunense]MBR7748124.1 GNAT family N-acetyltransferase [Undibacterium baiyunense]
MTDFIVRPMQVEDMDEILLVQAACYSDDIPESVESLRAKLLASPLSCFVAIRHDELIAYLISLPWNSSAPPALNAPTCEIPAHVDCLYLHDLSVHPYARGTGVARALIDCFFSRCAQWQMRRSCLVAVQNSTSYWQRFGFLPATTTAEMREKLSSYPGNAEFLMREIWTQSS